MTYIGDQRPFYSYRFNTWIKAWSFRGKTLFALLIMLSIQSSEEGQRLVFQSLHFMADAPLITSSLNRMGIAEKCTKKNSGRCEEPFLSYNRASTSKINRAVTVISRK